MNEIGCKYCVYINNNLLVNSGNLECLEPELLEIARENIWREKMVNIQEGERCVVGKTKDGKYSVWHKVMGKGTPPKFVEKERVTDIVDQLLEEFKQSEK